MRGEQRLPKAKFVEMEPNSMLIILAVLVSFQCVIEVRIVGLTDDKKI